MRAFILLEFIFGILILGIISIVCAKLLLQLKQKEIFTQNFTQQNIQIQNTLLQITNILAEAQDIQIKDNGLFFLQDNLKHQILMKGQRVLFDEVILLDFVEEFLVKIFQTNLLLKICMSKICLEKVILQYGD
ncbi:MULTISPECIES: hypothetical protein [unclassified Helicobacter]|uniref:hypothetical protein n=1 Tax=unclassified Helicobacter TaxID=2593540 RepID=UPI000CF14DAE|nr:MULTISPECIES: hypothetical protein [unclassified Helicobacter]